CTQLTFFAATPHSQLPRQGVDQGSDRTPPTTNRVTFDHLGEEHEKRDDERGEKLPDAKRGDERNGHRQLHRHAPLAQILPRLFENGESTDKRGRKSEAIARQPVPPPSGQAGHDDETHQSKPYVFGYVGCV